MRQIFIMASIVFLASCAGNANQSPVIKQEAIRIEATSSSSEKVSSVKAITQAELPYLGEFHKTQNGDFIGSISLEGYPYTKKVCDDDAYNYGKTSLCQQWISYVFFKIEKGITPVLQDFFQMYTGNSFVEPGAIGLGCETLIGTSDIGTLILSSVPNSPLHITLSRPFETGGKGASLCYSHFSIISASR